MRIYSVGGAVRDELLGRPVSDRDWVVVGSTPQALLDAGYLPVGRDFPVFLHPATREEVALARTERKIGPGYRGFEVHAAPDVTLEQDLARRDLTINAMARDAEGQLIDPHGGQRDLRARVLRHVSPAFAEDPVRILRVARFAARFADFEVAPETLALMREMVAAGEVDALVPERVWQELARGLMEVQPSRLFEVLRGCGALARLLPEIDDSEHLMRALDRSARDAAPLPVRWACVGHGARSTALLRTLHERLKVPNDCRELAEVLVRELDPVHRSLGFDAEALLGLLERCDALRKPARFELLLQACACEARGRLGDDAAPYPQAPRLRQALAAALAVDTATVAAATEARGARGPAVGAEIRAARLRALQARLLQPG